MAKPLIYILILLSGFYTKAQIHELGISVGGSNAITDIGSTNYIKPNTLTFGMQYRYNRSKRHSWRVSYEYIPIQGNDKKSTMPLRKKRGYSFTNTLQELSAGIEFNFLDFDLHNDWHSFSPYIYTGIAGFSYKNSSFTNDEQHFLKETNLALAVPLHLGVKTSINRRLILSGEIGVRYTLTDNLDGNNPNYKSISKNQSPFGETESNDWYVTTKITITYTFGKNPCYCLPNN